MKWFRRRLHTSQSIEAGKAMVAWPTSQNGEFVETWHNSGGRRAPDDWRQMNLDRHVPVKLRRRTGAICECLVSALDYAQLPSFPEGVGVARCVEQGADGMSVKHVIVRWLHRTSWDSEASELLEKISLLFEPKQPAFLTGNREPHGFYGHLTWPCDWNHAERLWRETLHGGLPNSPNPFSIVNEDISVEEKDVSTTRNLRPRINYNTEDYKSRVQNAGLGTWLDMVRQNLFMIGLAAACLDDQTARDLRALASMGPDPKGRMEGRVLQFLDRGVTCTLNEESLFGSRAMGTRIGELLTDRLDRCQACGYDACVPSEASASRTDPCCRFILGNVYPISTTWCIVTFEYECPECGSHRRLHRGVTLQDPAPVLPKRVPCSLYAFLQDLAKGV